MQRGELLGKMIHIAVTAHQGQFDMSGRPYVLHVLKVMELLNTDDEELQAIAVGHDLFEDTTVTAAQLRSEGIPERVIEGIRGLTKMPGQSYEEYQAGVFSSRDRMLVKSADLTHNMDLKRLKGVRPKDIERAGRYIEFYYAIQMRLLDPRRGVEGAEGVRV